MLLLILITSITCFITTLQTAWKLSPGRIWSAGHQMDTSVLEQGKEKQSCMMLTTWHSRGPTHQGEYGHEHHILDCLQDKINTFVFENVNNELNTHIRWLLLTLSTRLSSLLFKARARQLNTKRHWRKRETSDASLNEHQQDKWAGCARSVQLLQLIAPWK